MGLFLILFTGCAHVSDSLHSVAAIARKIAPNNRLINQAAHAAVVTADLTYNETGPMQETMLGYKISAKMLSNYKTLPPDSLSSKYVAKVGKTVVQGSDSPYTFNSYIFIVLDAPKEINAFAAPGGFVFITTGMLNFLKNEDELAAIIGHEVGHVEKQHGIQSAGRENVMKLLSLLSAAGKDHFNNDPQTKAIIDVLYAKIEMAIVEKMRNGYSIEMEEEADKRSIEIANNLGYNTMALSHILERYKEIKGSYGGAAYPKERGDSAKKYAKLISKGNFYLALTARNKRFQQSTTLLK